MLLLVRDAVHYHRALSFAPSLLSSMLRSSSCLGPRCPRPARSALHLPPQLRRAHRWRSNVAARVASPASTRPGRHARWGARSASARGDNLRQQIDESERETTQGSALLRPSLAGRQERLLLFPLSILARICFRPHRYELFTSFTRQSGYLATVQQHWIRVQVHRIEVVVPARAPMPVSVGRLLACGRGVVFKLRTTPCVRGK